MPLGVEGDVVPAVAGLTGGGTATGAPVVAQPNPTTSQVMASDAPNDCQVSLSTEELALLPPVDDGLPPSFLRGGRAWARLSATETLCDVRAADKRENEEDWRVHDGRTLRDEGRPPKPETKDNWPKNAFSVPYHLCVISMPIGILN
jgi:hypothetical protein